MMQKILSLACGLLFTAESSQALWVRVMDVRRASSAELSKVDQIAEVLNLVMNSDEFKNRVLNFKYLGINQFANNQGLTNQQIYDKLMAGEEEFPQPTKANQQADLYISMYDPPWYRRSGLAFTYPKDRYMYIYRQYFGSGTMPDLTNTFIHEWTHKIGFEHDYRRTQRRPYSVPYGVGGIIQSIVAAWSGVNATDINNEWDEEPPQDFPNCSGEGQPRS